VSNTGEQLTLFAQERPASRSQSPENEAEWMMTVASWPSDSLNFLSRYAHGGLYGRTSPVSCRLTADGILEPFSRGWGNAGMGSLTEFSTLDISESHSDAVESSLSDILQATGDVPQRYYLSAKACAGILRRAKKRGKALPEPLAAALEAVAGVQT